MYRAEKASSKLCRDREVEKAQELHRRKIDGVKSYLTAVTRPPGPSAPTSNKSPRPATFFRRSLRQAPKAPGGANHSSAGLKPFSAEHEGDAYSDEDLPTTSGDEEDGADDYVSSVGDHCDEVATKSFGKLDELRSVLVPVMAYKGRKNDESDLNYEQYLDAITNPPAPVQEPPKSHHPLHQTPHSLRASAFRLRRLKQIEADNVTIFDRIKNSSSHYRTEALRRDWDQNVAYLTSICEFPVVEDTLQVQSPRRIVNMGPRKRSPFPTRPPEQLPSLHLDSPPVIHPIKAIPTSPKKTTFLNLSPAFRSLRKGLPQVPALPPLAASPRIHHAMKSKSMTAVASMRSTCLSDDEAFPHSPQPSPPRRSPSPAARAGSPCIEEITVDDSSRYTLLKIGRFVGGKYLIVTVFCGDGITNPYGFDVVALDPEAHVEFHLSISKETTHRLLETISSSSMAERTAAAAGTNLSMELIAHCICDHIRYAQLDTVEMVFLVATMGNPGELSRDTSGDLDDEQHEHPTSHVSASESASVLVDTPYAAVAVCLHQRVRIPELADNERVGSFDVFASTRPQPCCRASMLPTRQLSASSSTSEFNGLVCFEVREEQEPGLRKPRAGQLQVSVSEFVRGFEKERVAVDSNARDRLSLDRLIALSFRFLHLEKAASADGADYGLVLTPSKPNTWLCPVGSPHRPSSTALTTSLDMPRTNSRHILTCSSSTQKLGPRRSAHDELKTVLETGMLWRGAYLLARVALLSPGQRDERTGKVLRDPQDELLVFNILNSSTGNSSERSLRGDQVEEFSQKLGAWQTTTGVIPPLIVFAKLLLLRMGLDSDLRGQEVIRFPTLEPRYHNAGGGSSRRNSPTKPILTEAKEAQPTRSLDAEAQEQTRAVITIQQFVRRYLQRRRRRQYRAGLHKTTETWSGRSIYDTSLPDVSLSDLVLEFVQNRAAKRIQFASRNFTERVRARRVHFSATPPLPEDEEVEHGHMIDSGVSAGSCKHIEVLGVLCEDEQEEDETEKESAAPVSQAQLHEENKETPLSVANDVPSTYRTGRKRKGAFALERHVVRGTQTDVIECQIIGSLGQLQRDSRS